MERFDFRAWAIAASEISEDRAEFLETWAKMDLAHVFGWPLWEKAVFHLLHRSFGDVRSIFSHYAKSGSAGASALAGSTLQQTELVNLALDCCLATEGFPMARVQGVFTRADLKDDGKLGDGALELHEFLEAMVQLSFSRANPKFGEAGHEAKAAHPLPDCLEQMMQQKLLQGSKKDGLAELKEEVLTDMEVHTLFRRYRPELKRIFEATGRARGRRLFGKPMLTIEARRSGARAPD